MDFWQGNPDLRHTEYEDKTWDHYNDSNDKNNISNSNNTNDDKSFDDKKNNSHSNIPVYYVLLGLEARLRKLSRGIASRKSTGSSSTSTTQSWFRASNRVQHAGLKNS